jgi:hypothetical protein
VLIQNVLCFCTVVLIPDQTHFFDRFFFSLRQEPGSDYAVSMRDSERSRLSAPAAAMIERQLSDFQHKERWRL